MARFRGKHMAVAGMSALAIATAGVVGAAVVAPNYSAQSQEAQRRRAALMASATLLGGNPK